MTKQTGLVHNKPEDMRRKRTRECLMDALIELMEEKSYREISIKELAKEACVARQTFYRNYESKDEILLQYMDRIFDDYVGRIQDDFGTENVFTEMARKLFSVWQENSKIFSALKRAGLIHKVLDRFMDYIVILQNEINKSAGRESQIHGYIAYFIAGGTFMVLNRWFDDNMNISIENLSGLFNQIMRFSFKIDAETPVP